MVGPVYKAAGIAAKFGVKRPSGGRFRIPCPAHGGEDKNLALWDGDGGGIGARCFSHDCSYQSIIEALGIEYTYSDLTYSRSDGSTVKRHRGPNKKVGGRGTNKGLRVRLWNDTTDAAVVLVEGEKAAHALTGYELEGYTAANWSGGTSSAHLADYSLLSGRIVILWPDNHDDGRAAMRKAGRLALDAGATRVRIVDVASLPAKGDAADVTGPQALSLVEAATDWEPEYALLDVDGLGPWSPTPTADAVRLLRFCPERLLAARNPADGTYRLFVDNGFGVWQPDAAALDKEITASAEVWNRKVAAAALRGELTGKQAESALKWALNAAKPAGRLACRESVGAAIELMRSRTALPEELTLATEAELDMDKDYLGAPNGVIDLNTGKLLLRAKGRKRLVTRQVPDQFNENAQHDVADELLGHLPAVERSYLLAALGFALRGVPARRWYLLEGERRSGKTTLLNAVVGCLGDVRANGYGMAINVQDLALSKFASPNAHHGGLYGVQYARIAGVSEPKAGGVSFNEGLILELTGGDALNIRDVREKSRGSFPATATLIVALNPIQITNVNLIDKALLDRTKILKYPNLELADAKVDPMRYETVRANPAVRQAVLALLVKAVAANPRPPVDVLSVKEAVEERHADSIGQVGGWLLRNVEVTRQAADRLYLDEVWNTLVERFGPESDKGLIEGRNRRQTFALAREVVEGLPQRKLAFAKSYWPGVRIRHGGADTTARVDEVIAPMLDGLADPPAPDQTFEERLARRVEALQAQIKETPPHTPKPGLEYLDNGQHLVTHMGNLLMLQEACQAAPAPPVSPAALAVLRAESVEDLADKFFTAAAHERPVDAGEWERILRDLRVFVEDEMQKQAQEDGWLARRLAQLAQPSVPGFEG